MYTRASVERSEALGTLFTTCGKWKGGFDVSP